jgi:hypothetical protein
VTNGSSVLASSQGYDAAIAIGRRRAKTIVNEHLAGVSLPDRRGGDEGGKPDHQSETGAAYTAIEFTGLSRDGWSKRYASWGKLLNSVVSLRIEEHSVACPSPGHDND